MHTRNIPLLFLLACQSAFILVGQNGGSPAAVSPDGPPADHAAHLVAPTPGGTVSGAVTDESGQPLVGCEVQLDNVIPSVHRPRPTSHTDTAGKFQTLNVPWGTYNVGTACRGYPSSLVALYTGHVRQVVTVTPDSSSVQANVVRTDKAGRITKINVFDGATGERITRMDPGSGNKIDSASVEIHRVDNLKWGIESGVADPYLYIPAQIPVIIKVWAQGYSTWYYGGATDPEHAKPLVLQAGQDISFDVTLQPVPEQ